MPLDQMIALSTSQRAKDVTIRALLFSRVYLDEAIFFSNHGNASEGPRTSFHRERDRRP